MIDESLYLIELPFRIFIVFALTNNCIKQIYAEGHIFTTYFLFSIDFCMPQSMFLFQHLL